MALVRVNPDGSLRTGIPVPRNTLFRERRVIISHEVTNPDGTLDIFTFELAEVRSISTQSAGSTAVLPGVTVPVIQPWYFQPITIEIQGESYMGAFENRVMNVLVDDDVENLWKLRQRVNEQFALTQRSVRGMIVTLTIGNPNRGNFSTDQTFFGFIDDIRTEESDEKPYGWTYTARFTGDFGGGLLLVDGLTGAREDAGLIASTATSGTEVLAQR